MWANLLFAILRPPLKRASSAAPSGMATAWRRKFATFSGMQCKGKNRLRRGWAVLSQGGGPRPVLTSTSLNCAVSRLSHLISPNDPARHECSFRAYAPAPGPGRCAVAGRAAWELRLDHLVDSRGDSLRLPCHGGRKAESRVD